jgi:hypothetical protein
MIRRRGPLYVYDGRDLFAVVEHRAEGWHATIRDNRFGPFASREMALAMVNAKRANVPAGTIVGERDADTKRVNRIRNHQRQAQTRIAESCRAPMRGVIPAWPGRSVHNIVRRDIKQVLREVAVTRPIMANRTLGHLSKFFRWLTNEDIITGSLCLGIERPAPEVVRDRVLTDAEVRAFWEATEWLPAPFGDIYRLLLLSTARRQEVGSDYVFGHRRTGFSHMKDRLDAAMKPETPWRTHDLRRTSRSLLSRARVPSDIAELMLGHLLPGMRRVYDRHKYLDERRAGFERLEREIDLILNPPAAAGKIVKLRS